MTYNIQDGFTALRVASAFGRLDVVRLLIEKGAPVNYQDKVMHESLWT